jgi:hypothetical protein
VRGTPLAILLIILAVAAISVIATGLAVVGVLAVPII